MLINSANLMGGSSEPDGFRGFGRVHLEAGLPLAGMGNRGLLVIDSSTALVSEGSIVHYAFRTQSNDNNAGAIRATLAWIDPPASTLSAKQVVHDLDLAVTAPSGSRFTMWLGGQADTANVIERVIISAGDFAAEESGKWTVSVSANELSTESQSYSLVVWGPFGNGTAIGVVTDESAASPSHGRVGGTYSGLSLAIVLPLVARVGAELISRSLFV